MLFTGKVVLGVTGSISAYKSLFIARELIKQGCEIQVVFTQAAARFVTPLSFSALTSRPVLSSMIQGETNTWNNHVHLASWCQLLLIAPMTANTLANLANGQCTELLHAVYLSAKSAVLACPAMDHDMWHHATVKRNLATLLQDGVEIMMPVHGELASGIVGDGRLPEPLEVVAHINQRYGKP